SSPFLGQFAENDQRNLYLAAELRPSYEIRHAFIDTDSDPTTGYPYNGIGASYLIENDTLFRHVGPGWVWERVGDANHEVDGAHNGWAVPRADLGLAEGSPVVKVVFQAHGGAPSVVAPPVVHRFSR